MSEIQREDDGRHGSFFIEQEGRRVAGQFFTLRQGGKSFSIDHTEVDESLRGQGIARKLTLAAVDWARKSGMKVIVVCPFARAVFDRDPSLHDVLVTR
jgi:predicted GNAT family acetyltransferase